MTATLSDLNLSDVTRQWDELGYVVVRRILDPARTQLLRIMCEDILGQWRIASAENGKPGGAEATNMRHLNHPAYFKSHPEWFAPMMETIADPKILEFAEAILGDRPFFRSTSLFMNPTTASYDGHWHRDSQFMTKTDAEEQKMVGDWQRTAGGVQLQIPLVPSEDTEFVPRSHLRWDTPEEYGIRKADGGANNKSNEMPGAQRFRLEAGDGAAFNPIGLHRGRYHCDKLRRTLMLTYTRSENNVQDYFSYQPWFHEPAHLDGLSPKAREFFEEFIAAYHDFWRDPASRKFQTESGG